MSDCTIPMPELTGCIINGRNSNGTDTAAPTTLVESTTTTEPVASTTLAETTTAVTYEIGTPPELIALPATGMGPEIALVASLMVLTGWALRRMTRRENRWFR